ncbi:MAG: hypothetical protein A07HR67_01352 [uncultured archaeon A07HR67]|jgi:hypothetical protein|nr:MAG: hypothetical protein A07HR67_01352 [uncultured archaeon A07HR67]
MGTRGTLLFSLGLAGMSLLAALTGAVIFDPPAEPRATDAASQPTNAPYSPSDEDGGSENDGNGSSDGANDSETADNGTAGERDDASTTERSDFDLADIAGLATLIAIVLGTLFLIRRAPR